MISKSLLLLLWLFVPTQVLTQSKGIRKLIPHHASLQFAGGIGFLSAGIGYDSKNKRLQGDFYYGYVPEKLGGITIHSVTGKFTWAALSHKLSNTMRWHLLTTGILFNYAFGKQYFLFDPDNYPFSYYRFPTAMHIGLFAGGGFFYRKTQLYYELGTTDKELVSYINNTQSLTLGDIINLGIGMRIWFK
jgi:hypothetical protein